jgi:hypothetical protein
MKMNTTATTATTTATATTWVVAQKVSGPTGGRFIVAKPAHPAGGFMTSRQSSDWLTFEDQEKALEWAARCGSLRVIPKDDAPAWLA